MKTMKLFVTLLLMTLSVGVMAQSDAKKAKAKQTKAELKEKASKTARKESKKWTKEGWQVSPGALPLEKQLDRSYQYELDTDEDLNPLYIIGQGQSIGENYDAARIQATELARLEIAGKIGSEATSLIDNMVGNKQLGNEEAASMTTILAESKTIFSQKLGRVKVAVECYRVLENKNREVLVRLVAKESDLREIAKSAIREELEKRGVKMSEELSEIISKSK